MLYNSTSGETSICSIHQHSRDKNVFDYFVGRDISKCCILSLRERRACVQFINILETSMCWIASFVERWADVAFFHSERDERVFNSSTFERQECVGLLRSLRDEQMLYNSTSGETSICSIHQHSRDKHVLDYFIGWDISQCCILSLRERRACILFINIQETVMCYIRWEMSVLLINIWERACTMMLHLLAYEHLRRSFAPGETGMCFIDPDSSDEHVMWYFTFWQMSMCSFNTLFERRVHSLSLHSSTECAWHCSTVDTRHLCSPSSSIIQQDYVCVHCF